MGKNRLPPESPQDDGQSLPHESAPPKSAPMQLCWMCDLEILNKCDGRNIENPKNERVLHIHHSCWSKIPDEQKVMIRMHFANQRSSDQLTMMLHEAKWAISAFHQLIDMGIREYRHRGDEETGGGAN